MHIHREDDLVRWSHAVWADIERAAASFPACAGDRRYETYSLKTSVKPSEDDRRRQAMHLSLYILRRWLPRLSRPALLMLYPTTFGSLDSIVRELAMGPRRVRITTGDSVTMSFEADTTQFARSPLPPRSDPCSR